MTRRTRLSGQGSEEFGQQTFKKGYFFADEETWNFSSFIESRGANSVQAGGLHGGDLHAQTHTRAQQRTGAETLSVSSFTDQMTTGNTRTVRSVGTRPHKAVQWVFALPKCGVGGSSPCAPSTPDGETLADPEGNSCPLNEAVKCEQVSVFHLFTSHKRQCEARRLVQ